jgi:hypothetical protein
MKFYRMKNEVASAEILLFTAVTYIDAKGKYSLV